MIVDNAYLARPSWYDRTPTGRGQLYNATIAPAGTTVRWTYTVPTAKKALVDVVTMQATRQTAAAPIGEAAALIEVTSLDASVARLIQSLFNNTVGAAANGNFAAAIPMQAGETLIGKTYDFSTGGTVNYNVAAHLVEFDA